VVSIYIVGTAADTPQVAVPIAIPMILVSYLLSFVVAQCNIVFSTIYAADPIIIICTIILCLPFLFSLNCLFLIVAAIVGSIASTQKRYLAPVTQVQQQSQSMTME